MTKKQNTVFPEIKNQKYPEFGVFMFIKLIKRVFARMMSVTHINVVEV